MVGRIFQWSHWPYQFSKECIIPKTDSSIGRPRRSYQKLTECLRQFMKEDHFRDGGELPPGRAPTESFGVSRGSTHEAIRALAEKGLPEGRQGDETYVRMSDIEPLKETILKAVDSEDLIFNGVTRHRRIVESGIVEIVAMHHTSEQLDRLEIIVCDQQRHLLVGGNDGGLNAGFHPALAECTGNELLIDAITQLSHIYAEGHTPELRDTPWRRFSASSHLHIIDALE